MRELSTATGCPARARRKGRLRGRSAVLPCVLAAALAACAAGTEPSASIGPPSGSGQPAPTAVARPSPSLAGRPCTDESLRTYMDELMAAIGNPDTDAPSEASQAFDDAIASRDRSAIESAAAVVLGHLATAHAAIGAGPSGSDPKLAIACAEWTEMVGDIEEGVALTRDGGVAGSEAQVTAGRALVAGALQDHFWQAVKGDDPTMFVEPLADGRTASASRARLGTGARQAFDGNPETAWTTGDALPPQWVELDLGWPATLSGVRLVTFQDADGATDHAVTVRDASGGERDLTRFTGETHDRDTLEYLAPSPVADVRVLRVTTQQNPGTIGWREIEVVLAPGSAPSNCPASKAPITGLTAMGGPPQPGTTPDMAIDGDPATAWDPGPSGSLAVQLARPALVSTVRVLIGEAPPGAPGWSVQVFDGTHWVLIGQLPPTGAIAGWLAIAGPAPCVAITGVQLAPLGVEPNPAIREVQILGSTAP